MSHKFSNILIILILVVSIPLIAQVPNGGFEEWSGGNPTGWFTSNLAGFWTNVTQVSPGHSGSWALRGDVITSTSGDTVLPLLAAGASADGFGISERYNSLHGFYKFSPVGGDVILVTALMYQNHVNLGGGVILISNPAASFSEFSVPITFNSEGSPDVCVIQIALSNSMTKMHPGSFFVIDDLSLSGATTVEPDITGNPPHSFSLEQNCPNPFNPSTTIGFIVPQSDFVTLKVFNTVGQEIETLVSDRLEPGRYTVRFDGQNLPSGIYFSEMTARTFRQVKRMVLLR